MSSSESEMDEKSHPEISSSESEMDEKSHAKALKRLGTTDPEFYQFLKENDQKLLHYDDSDEEDDEADLEENATNSEIEDESTIISEVETLRDELQNSPNLKICKKVMSLLKSSISQPSNSSEELSIMDGGLFNDVIKLCLVELVPALSKALHLPQHSDVHSMDPSKSRLWKKASTHVKAYLIDMLKILSYLSDPSTLELVLKHVMRLIPYYIQFLKLARLLAKKMIHVWSTSTEKARILAFLALYRVFKKLPNEYHSQILKQMYFAYVRNTKFCTVSSLPLITFMKRSLVELYSSQPEVSYEHAFLYIRQLCIHLRNAVTTKKKESFQTVYNWQCVNCIILWGEVICALYTFEPIKTLVYPLVQLTTGAINLIPTAKYAPLRFHLINVLIQISSSTKVFIPIAPLILDVLNFVDSQKKLAFSKKVMNLTCVLKASKSELQESGFRDLIVSEVCKLLTEYFTIYTSSISFPELSFLAIHQLKAFLKKNKIAKYGQQIKAIVDKLQQNGEFISQKRNAVSFPISDADKVQSWEDSVLKEGTPLLKHIVRSTEPSSSEPPRKKKKHN